MVQLLWATVTRRMIGPSIVLLDIRRIYSKELRVGTQTGMCIPKATLHTIAIGQTKCSSTEEWINKM
jgi:hypothetical protein